MNTLQIAEEIGATAEQIRMNQAQILDALSKEQRIIAQQCNQRLAKQKTVIDIKTQTVLAKQKRKSVLAMQRVNHVVNLLIGEQEIEALRVAEYVQIGALFLTANTKIDPDQTVPFIVPLLGHGSIAYQSTSTETETTVQDAIRFLEMRVLEKTASRQLEIVSYDPLLENAESPFAGINKEDEGTSPVRYVQSSTQLNCLLDELVERNTRIHNECLSEGGNIINHYQAAGMPTEPYQLIVFHNYPEQVSADQHIKIMSLVKSSAVTGISFVFYLSSKTEFPKWFDLSGADITKIIINDASGRGIWEGHPEWTVRSYCVSVQEASKVAQKLAEKSMDAALPALPLTEILPKKLFESTSADGITFSIGKANGKTVDITLGASATQRHNMLVTGAVGQGKSNLIKVIIYSLCSRYSPEELNLYLLDFKEGITLYPMAPSPESPEYLPHARVLGLEADQDYGIEVLRGLLKEMSRRTTLMRAYGENILAYRQATGKQLPRILLVVDEFQILLDGDRGREAQRLLESVVRLGRSAGIHVILASQSIEGIASLVGSQESFFAQFPIRVGLKNSPSQSRATFGGNNIAASLLRYRGQAILNENYGEISANRTVLIAAADDQYLTKLRNTIYKKTVETRKPPLVFDGRELPGFYIDLRKELFKPSSGNPFGLVGRSLKIDQRPVRFEFDDGPNRNVAVIGRGSSSEEGVASSEQDISKSVLNSVITSLALSSSSNTPFTFLSYSPQKEWWEKELIPFLKSAGHDVEIVDRSSFKNWFTAQVENLQAGKISRQWVIGPSMDRAGSFDFSFQGQLQNLLQEGPLWGMHFVLCWAGANAINSQLGINGLASFDGVAVLFGTETISRSVIGPMCKWNGQNKRVLFRDVSSGSSEEKAVPYLALSSLEKTKIVRQRNG